MDLGEMLEIHQIYIGYVWDIYIGSDIHRIYIGYMWDIYIGYISDINWTYIYRIYI